MNLDPVDTSYDPSSIVSPVRIPTNRESVKGPLGSRGTLGDILGGIGDLLGVTHHGQDVQRAKQLDAIEGADFASNPMGALQKLVPLVGLDKAVDIQNSFLLGEARKAQGEGYRIDNEEKGAANPLKILELKGKAIPRAAAIAGTVTDKNVAQVGQQVRNYLKQYDFLDGSGFPATDDPVAIKEWAKTGIPIAKQVDQANLEEDRDEDNARQDRSVDNQIENRNTNTSLHAASVGESARHNRATEAKGPKQTEADVVQGLIDRQTDGKPLSQGEKARVKKFTTGTKTPKAAPSESDLSYLRAHPESRDRFDGHFGVGMSKKVLGE